MSEINDYRGKNLAAFNYTGFTVVDVTFSSRTMGESLVTLLITASETAAA